MSDKITEWKDFGEFLEAAAIRYTDWRIEGREEYLERAINDKYGVTLVADWYFGTYVYLRLSKGNVVRLDLTWRQRRAVKAALKEIREYHRWERLREMLPDEPEEAK